MLTIRRNSLLSAQLMYLNYIKFLQTEISRITDLGIELGQEHETQTMERLDTIDRELENIEDCLGVIRHLLGN